MHNKVIQLDAWLPDEVELLAQVGNARAAAVYAAGGAVRGGVSLEQWARDKYELRRHYDAAAMRRALGSPPTDANLSAPEAGPAGGGEQRPVTARERAEAERGKYVEHRRDADAALEAHRGPHVR